MALSLLTFVLAQWEFDIPLVIRVTIRRLFLTCTDRTGDVDKSIIENQTMLSWERLFLITRGGAFTISAFLMFALANNKKAASHELIKPMIYGLSDCRWLPGIYSPSVFISLEFFDDNSLMKNGSCSEV